MHAQENVPAPKRSSRKRGTPAMALESIGEEAEPEEDMNSKPEAPAQAEALLQTDLEADAEEGAPEGTGAQVKPPLPGKARRGRAAEKEEAEQGMQDIHAHKLRCPYYRPAIYRVIERTQWPTKSSCHDAKDPHVLHMREHGLKLQHLQGFLRHKRQAAQAGKCLM